MTFKKDTTKKDIALGVLIGAGATLVLSSKKVHNGAKQAARRISRSQPAKELKEVKQEAMRAKSKSPVAKKTITDKKM